MGTMYGILAAIGWTWALVAFVYLWHKLRRPTPGRGFDVVAQHEEQH